MKHILYIFIFSLVAFANGQTSLDSLLQKENKQSVPYISAEALQKKQAVLLLDSREKEEYDISHLENAIHVGYRSFRFKKIENILPKDKTTPIVVYCSLGIRSEDIAEKIQKEGYTNVYNLYGGIFEWKNNDFPIMNSKGNHTEKVHAFNKEWSIWLKNGIKVFSVETSESDS